MSKSITIVRQFKGVGIDAFLRGYDMETGEELRRAVYHGRIVYLKCGKQIGLPGLKKKENKCNVTLNQEEYKMPF